MSNTNNISFQTLERVTCRKYERRDVLNMVIKMIMEIVIEYFVTIMAVCLTVERYKS